MKSTIRNGLITKVYDKKLDFASMTFEILPLYVSDPLSWFFYINWQVLLHYFYTINRNWILNSRTRMRLHTDGKFLRVLPSICMPVISLYSATAKAKALLSCLAGALMVGYSQSALFLTQFASLSWSLSFSFPFHKSQSVWALLLLLICRLWW